MSTAPLSTSAAERPAAFADPGFQRRRTVNWLTLGLLYAFFYMTRYNFAATMPDFAAMFGWSNTDLGVFEFVMPMVYGISVVANGPIADRIGGKRAFLFGALGVVAANAAFGACTLLVVTPAVVVGKGHDAHVVTAAVLSGGFTSTTARNMMAAIWGVNGYFQSFGALSIVKVNAHWFHVRERGTFAGVFGVLIRVGLILAFSGVPLIVLHMPLRYGFWIPAACVAVLFALNLFFMVDSPNEAGYEGMDTGEGDDPGDQPARFTAVLAKVFASRSAWLIALCSMMLGMVRRSTVDSWWPKYFRDVFGGAGSSAGGSMGPYQVAVYAIATLGIVGGFAFGMTSDRVFGSRRAPVITVGFLGMTVALVLLGLSGIADAGPYAAGASLALLSFFVNGAHGMIGGAASMDFGGRKAAATAAGLFDGMQYLASAFVGPGMGYVVDTWGWSWWPWVPIPFALVGAAVISRLWNAVPGRAPAPPPAAAVAR